jgi:hypothetical protein
MVMDFICVPEGLGVYLSMLNFPGSTYSERKFGVNGHRPTTKMYWTATARLVLMVGLATYYRTAPAPEFSFPLTDIGKKSTARWHRFAVLG